MSDASLRASDDDRDRAIAALREHLVAGRLTHEEFGQRLEQVLSARFLGDLDRAQVDLPATATVRWSSRRRPLRVAAALFGGAVYRGRLRLSRRSLAAAVLGDLDLDLRELAADHPPARVHVLALLGNVDVYVPEGVGVDITGITVIGHRREWGRDIAAEELPRVQLRTFGFFGTIDVWRVPLDMHGDYAELFRQLQAQQRQLPG